MASTSPSEDFERATSCSPPLPNNIPLRQNIPKENKGLMCRQPPQDVNVAWHWALRGGACNRYGDPMLEGFSKSESSRSRYRKNHTQASLPERQTASPSPSARRRRSPIPEKIGDDFLSAKAVVLLPAGDAEKRSQLRRVLRTRLVECESIDELETESREILEIFSHGRTGILNAANPFLSSFKEDVWRYQPDVAQQVWRNAIYQVVEQETQRCKKILSHVKQEIVRKGQRAVAEQPALHRNTTFHRKTTHQSSDTVTQREVEETDANKEKRWKITFGRLSCGARLRVDDVPRALELCGIMSPQSHFIDEILGRVTKSHTLSCEEFIRVIQLYLERQHLEYRLTFKKFDVDGDENIDVDELREVLKSLGIVPLAYVLEDLIGEIDQEESARFEFKEFVSLLEQYKCNEGFPVNERKQFETFFSRLDQNDDGLIATELLGGALGWLGYNLTEEEVLAIAKETDVDSSGSLDWTEFLRCMRKIREKEIEILKQALVIFDADHSNSIGSTELENLLASLGMTCDQEAVIHAAEDSGTNPQDMGIDDLWKFIHLYRSRDGLSRDECELVDAAFDRYDSEKMDKINVVDLGKALRWFGYQVSFETQRRLTELVDVDRSGRLNKQELRKTIRLYWEGELKKMREVFVEEQARGGKCTLTFEQTMAAFRRLDLVDDARGTPMLPSDRETGIDLATFMNIAVKQKKAMRDVFRQNAGYTQKETVAIHRVFDEHDIDKSDSIGTSELGVLIQSIFPVMNFGVRSKLDFLMKEIDADGPGTGRLSFDDFLRTMRQFHDIQNQERAAKELRIVDDTKFNFQEVQGFRDIFSMCDTNGDSLLATHEIKTMLKNVCPLGDKNLVLLGHLIDEVCTQEKVTVVGDLDRFDFPEFLLLMRKMLDVNFASIKERLSIVC